MDALQPIASALYDLARRADQGLKNPTAWGADLLPWFQAAAGARERNDIADLELAETAIWLGLQVKSVRETFEPFISEHVNGSDIPILTFANANLTDIVFERRHKKKVSEKIDGAFLDSFVTTPIHIAETGQDLNLDDFRTNLGDAAQWCLLSARHYLNNIEWNDPKSTIEKFFEYKSLEHTIAKFWQMVLWDNWILTKERDTWLLRPRFPDWAKLEESWVFGYSAQLLDATMSSLDDWRHIGASPKLRKQFSRNSVVAEKDSTPQLKVRRIKPKTGRIDLYWTQLGILSRTYIHLYLSVHQFIRTVARL